jgi:hypothetical protein
MAEDTDTALKGTARRMTHRDIGEGSRRENAMNTQLKSVSTIEAIEQGRSKRFAQRGLIGATLVVLLSITLAMSQTFIHHSPAAVNHPGPTTQQRWFLEVNTTSLPASVMPDVAPVAVSSDRAKFLEANTVLGMVADDAAPVASSISARRFIEVNTDLGMADLPAYPYGEAVTPVRGPR